MRDAEIQHSIFHQGLHKNVKIPYSVNHFWENLYYTEEETETSIVLLRVNYHSILHYGTTDILKIPCSAANANDLPTSPNQCHSFMQNFFYKFLHFSCSSEFFILF